MKTNHCGSFSPFSNASSARYLRHEELNTLSNDICMRQSKASESYGLQWISSIDEPHNANFIDPRAYYTSTLSQQQPCYDCY